ncbi:MAG: tetratricopeptide repeat protein [Bacteroidales bacterium]
MGKNITRTNNSDKVEAVESALSRSEQFIENNQKIITIVVIALVAVVGLYLAYQRWYLAPQNEEASSQMFVAEQNFELDSFDLALKGDLNYPGFLTIIDEYSSTEAANLAYYYAGVCYLKQGKFDEAIEYLSNFDSKDKMLKPESLGMIGDAYLELKQVDKAAEYYIKAGNFTKNDFFGPLYLMRAGAVLESKKDYKGALEQYNNIKENYRNSPEGRTIEKYITRAEILMKK